MKKIVAVLVLFVGLVSAEEISYSVNPDSTGISQILDLSLNREVINEIQELQKLMNDRMIGEAHIGIAYASEFEDVNVREGVVGTFSLFLTPFTRKIPQVKEVKNRVHKIRSLSKLRGKNLSKYNQKVLKKIEDEIKIYESKRGKNISFGLTFTANTFINKYERGDYNPYTSSYEQVLIGATFYPEFTGDLFVSVGYDIGDFGTVNLGITPMTNPKFLVGYSFDISTPTYANGSRFLNYLLRFSPVSSSSYRY